MRRSTFNDLTRLFIFLCLSGLPEDKENMETDDTLEPPLCSCRMETPKNQDVVTLAEGKCMAVESVDGKVEHASALLFFSFVKGYEKNSTVILGC